MVKIRIRIKVGFCFRPTLYYTSYDSLALRVKAWPRVEVRIQVMHLKVSNVQWFAWFCSTGHILQ